MPRLKAPLLLLSLATLCVPALAQGTNPAVGDTSTALNFVQGKATLDGQPVTTDPAHSLRPLHAGEVLATAQGTADLTLAPGSLLRLGENTSAQLVAIDSHRAEVRLDSGKANVVVNAIPAKTLLLVDLPNGQTQMLERGLYTFDTATQAVRVFHGKADVFPGVNTTTDVKPVKVKGGHEVELSDARIHPQSFEISEAQDLLPWTGPQEARADGDVGLSTNPSYDSGGGGYAPVASGFYGDPYGFGFGYPSLAFGFGEPWGFFGNPYGLYGYPAGLGLGFGYYGGGFYGGYPGYGYVRGGRALREGDGDRDGLRRGAAGGRSFRGGSAFHGGGAEFHGGGGEFHGGGGGFHGGGGGGFHGGGGGGFHGGGGGGFHGGGGGRR